MRHTRKLRAGSGVGQVISRGGEGEALEEGGKEKAEDPGYHSESDTDSLRTQRHRKREECLTPFLLSSLSSASAMAEAGAGLSETVTETTVTVTTEPVRKAGGGRCREEGTGLWEVAGGAAGFGKMGDVGLKYLGLGELQRTGNVRRDREVAEGWKGAYNRALGYSCCCLGWWSI